MALIRFLPWGKIFVKPPVPKYFETPTFSFSYPTSNSLSQETQAKKTEKYCANPHRVDVMGFNIFQNWKDNAIPICEYYFQSDVFFRMK